MTILDFPDRLPPAERPRRDFTELLPIGVFRTNNLGELIFVNSCWLEITGVSEARAMQGNWLKLIHPQDLEMVAQCWLQTIVSREEFDLEFRFLTPAGRQTWVRCRAQAEYDSNDTFIGYLGSVSDITQLKESQQQLLTILNNLSDVVVLIGENGRIQRINPAVEALFGYKPVELIGEHYAILVMPDERDRLLSYFRDTLQNRIDNVDFGGVCLRGCTSSGGVVEIEVNIDESQQAGDQRCFIGVMRDVSERTRRELYIRESQKMSALAQVTRGVSHEFSNLLSVMMGNMELLALKLDPQTRDQYIEPSLQAGEKGGDLVQRLLAFNRQQPLCVAVTGIRHFMCELRQSVNTEADGGITIDLVCGKDSAINVDPGHLQICMQQILLNAEEACLQRGLSLDKVVVGIDVRDVELDAGHQLEGHSTDRISKKESGDYVRVSISDKGVGMDEKTLMRCIEPFFSTKADHAGLGLSSVAGFIHQSSGFVSISSVTGSMCEPSTQKAGTTVHLYLPRTST